MCARDANDASRKPATRSPVGVAQCHSPPLSDASRRTVDWRFVMPTSAATWHAVSSASPVISTETCEDSARTPMAGADVGFVGHAKTAKPIKSKSHSHSSRRIALTADTSLSSGTRLAQSAMTR